MEIVQFQHLMTEIKESICNGDSIKLVAVAKDFPNLSDEQETSALNLLNSLAEDEFKLKLIAALISRKVSFGEKWIEFSRPLLMNSPQYLGHCIAVVSPEKVNIFDLLLGCVEENLNEENVKYLGKLLGKCSETSQIIRILKAIEKCPAEDIVGAITEYLFVDSRVLQIKSLDILKNLKSGSSIKAMLSALGRESQFDILIINALEDIKTEESYRGLVDALGVNSSQVRYFASQKLKSNSTLALPALNSKLHESSTDIAIAILVILKEIGLEESAKEIRSLIMFQPNSANLRSAAYDALAEISFVKSSYLMVAGLEDPVDDVAFAVAGHIESYISPNLIKGLLNVVESKVQPVKRLVEVFSYSRCDKVIKELSVNEEFKSALDEFVALQGKNHISNGLNSDPVIWAVDDSGLILRMYERFSKDYNQPVKTFICAEDAMAELEICATKPELIFTDLNMGEMNGIAFAEAVRKLNMENEIPMYLVTTQTSADKEIKGKEGLFKGIIPKPFTSEMLIENANLIFNKDA